MIKKSRQHRQPVPKKPAGIVRPVIVIPESDRINFATIASKTQGDTSEAYRATCEARYYLGRAMFLPDRVSLAVKPVRAARGIEAVEYLIENMRTEFSAWRRGEWKAYKPTPKTKKLNQLNQLNQVGSKNHV
jgi:hypothetical protein